MQPRPVYMWRPLAVIWQTQQRLVRTETMITLHRSTHKTSSPAIFFTSEWIHLACTSIRYRRKFTNSPIGSKHFRRKTYDSRYIFGIWWKEIEKRVFFMVICDCRIVGLQLTEVSHTLTLLYDTAFVLWLVWLYKYWFNYCFSCGERGTQSFLSWGR